jgi:hypothetical protein
LLAESVAEAHAATSGLYGACQTSWMFLPHQFLYNFDRYLPRFAHGTALPSSYTVWRRMDSFNLELPLPADTGVLNISIFIIVEESRDQNDWFGIDQADFTQTSYIRCIINM